MHQDEHLNPITLPLYDSRLIEASAGTGKTYTIALLYLRLVLGLRGGESVTEPLTPPQILVTTFTQAAVEELRDRIRARLSEMATVFMENRPPTAKPLAALFALYPDQPERDHAAFLLQRAAEWMDEAAIYTIHGFCQRMLSEHAFHSRALFEQTLITDLEPFKEQAVRDFWRTHGYALNEQLPKADIFAETFQSPAHLYEKIRYFLQRDGRPVALGDQAHTHSQSLPAFNEMIAAIAKLRQAEEKAEAHARQMLLHDYAQLESAWLEARSGLNQRSHPEAKTAEDLQNWLALFRVWAESGEVAIEDKQFTKLTTPKLRKDTQLPAEVTALSAIEDWQLLRKHNKAKIQERQKKMWAFGVLWVRERIGHELERQQKMSFEDLLNQMDQALAAANPNAAAMSKSIRRQYPVAMIDEFQDTDPQQLRIFDAIYDIERSTTDANSAIILIGDPKQAIYGFRGADIYSYLQARVKTEGRHATLGVNFRSTHQMVEAVNQLFLQAEAKKPGVFSIEADSDAQTLAFNPVSANGRSDQLRDSTGVLPAVHLWHLPTNIPLRTEEFRTQMAEICAEDISRKLTASQQGLLGFGDGRIEKPLTASDIAILVRSHHEAKQIRTALGQRDVPCVFLSESASVFQSEQAVDLSRWLAAMHQPERADLIRLALSTRSSGLSRARLVHYLEHEPAFDQVSQLFVQLKQIWAEQGVLAGILKLVHFFGLGEQQNSAVSRSNARILTNIMHLADWLNQKSEQIEGQAALMQRLEQAREHDPGEQELRLEQDANLVRIITIHKAKGLQFPVVYLPFLAAAGLNNHKKEPLVQTVNGQKQIQFTPEDIDLKKQKSEEQAEDMRLLYVGLTRAEYSMSIGLGPVIAGKGKKWNMQTGPVGRLLGLDIDPEQAEISFNQAVQSLDQYADIKSVCLDDLTEKYSRFSAQKAQFTPTVRTPEPRDFKPWWISSFSALTGHYHRDITAPEDARAEQAAEPNLALSDLSSHTASLNEQHDKVQNLPKGAAMGTLLHDLIERVLLLQQEGRDPRTPEQWQDWMRQARHPLKPPETDLQTTLATWLNDLFSMPINTPDGSVFSLKELSLFQTEMEFWFSCCATHTRDIDERLEQYIHPAQTRPQLARHQLNGMIKGFIDLVFEFEGRYYLIDWKSNYLGAHSEHYQPENLNKAVLNARYDLQFSLYTLALHRHLADRIVDYDYEQHFGGVIYVFLRGIYANVPDNPANSPGVYLQRPPLDLIQAMETGFADQQACV